MFGIVFLTTNCCIDKIESDLHYYIDEKSHLKYHIITHPSVRKSPFAVQINDLELLHLFLL